MSARTPRRRFASPFVVTLAAIPACNSSTRTNNPPPPEPPPLPSVQAEPPAPSPTPDAPAPQAGAPIEPEPPPPVDEKRMPANYDQRWTVTKVKGQADCRAYRDVKCPTAEKGKPVPTCNPPPPTKYACPEGLGDGQSLKIILRSGATECFQEYGQMKCPPNMNCNPPPPRKLPCPT